tara:strand:- start:673 stop:1083 length:411 start_codon:yes stop_codon:yes gene_type:complete
MSNVIQFPLERKVENIAKEINTLQGQITERFENLTKLFVASRELEKECGELQVRYDSLVMQYAAAIGPENIPAGMLEYCTQVITTCDGDTGEISVALENAPTAEELVKKSENPMTEVQQFVDTLTKFLKGKMDELQ